MKEVNDMKLNPPEIVLSEKVIELSKKLAEKLIKKKEELPRIENIKT